MNSLIRWLKPAINSVFVKDQGWSKIAEGI